jgi:hypothetical protein
MDYTELFVTRNLLFESGRNQFYKNIVFVSREDKDYLKLMGKGMFDGFTDNMLFELEDLKKTSYLCKSLLKESQFQMEEYKHVYIKSDTDLVNNKFDEGIYEGTVKEPSEATNTYKLIIHHENVILYFPVLENWCHYMKPKMQNETFETREIIKCVAIPAEKWKKQRKLLIHVYNHNLVEKIN